MVWNPYTDRRSFLTTLSVAGIGSLAGYFGGTADSSSGDDTSTGGETNESCPTPTENGEDATTGTPSQESYTDLVVGEPEIVTIERSYSDRVGGQVAITNEGNERTADFTVGLDWLDENDEYLATSELYGRVLEPGETWIARTAAFLDVDEPEQVESAEATVTEERSPDTYTTYPDDIDVTDETVRASEDDVVVRGTIENNRDTSEFIEVAAKVYDEEENVLAMDWTIEEVEGGDSWRFEVTPETWGRNGQVDSGTVIPYIETL